MLEFMVVVKQGFSDCCVVYPIVCRCRCLFLLLVRSSVLATAFSPLLSLTFFCSCCSMRPPYAGEKGEGVRRV